MSNKALLDSVRYGSNTSGDRDMAPLVCMYWFRRRLPPPPPFCSAILNTITHVARTAEPVCSLFCDGHHDGLGKIFSKDAARCGH